MLQIESPVQVARRSDMDMNGHINNVTYLGWALETVPADVYLKYSLQEVHSLALQKLQTASLSCLPTSSQAESDRRRC